MLARFQKGTVGTQKGLRVKKTFARFQKGMVGHVNNTVFNLINSIMFNTLT